MFTENAIKALKPSSSVRRIREKSGDHSLRGFGITVSTAGTRSFYLAYTSPETNKRTQVTIGKYPVVKLAEARQQARKVRELIDDGIDPIFEKIRHEKAKEAAENERNAQEWKESSMGSVEKLFDLYVKNLKLDGKRSAHFVQLMYDHDIKSPIGRRKVKDITKEDISDIITQITKRGALVMANRTRSYLHSAFEFSLFCNSMPRWRGKVPDFGLQYNPVAATQKALKNEKPGQRYLNKEEIKCLWSSMGVEAMDLHTSLAVKLLIATGQRVEEVLHARWSEFDISELIWVIPAERRKTKFSSYEPHIVPLTIFHKAILDEIKIYSGSSKWLFPHSNGIGPRTSGALSQAVRRFCIPKGGSNRAPFEKFQPRDLRRTWKTLAGSIGISLEDRNRVQGHAFQDVGSRHYDRYSYLSEKTNAMNKWINWLEAVLTVDTGHN
jgi:integrase